MLRESKHIVHEDLMFVRGVIGTVLFALCLPCSAVLAQERTLEIISVSSEGMLGNDSSSDNSIGASGRFVVFSSLASNLVDGDTNGCDDIFVRDRVSGTTERVSVGLVPGNNPDGDSWSPSISADGKLILFSSEASNLVVGDNNDDNDIFLHNRENGVTARLSGDLEDYADVSYVVVEDGKISDDGRYALLSFYVELDDGDTYYYDLYLLNIDDGTRIKIVDGATCGQEECEVGGFDLSADGRYIVFDSSHPGLVPGDTNEVEDVFVYDRVLAQTTLISKTYLGLQTTEWSADPMISADGRFVAYESNAADIVAEGASGSVRNIYLYDRGLLSTSLVTRGVSGETANGNSYLGNLSEDGSFVTYYSYASNLTADTDGLGQSDIFLYSRVLNETSRMSETPEGLSADDNSYDPSLSADGSLVSFLSYATNLHTDDEDGDGQIYLVSMDACPADPEKRMPGLCGCGVADIDTDGDKTPDCSDLCVSDPHKVVVGLCGCGVADTDSDEDGTPDCFDFCVSDPHKVVGGLCGCGVVDTDSDGDGTPDCSDLCVSDPHKVAVGPCGCGVADTDSDDDGKEDCHDQCMSDPRKVSPGICGCGVEDSLLDTDQDGEPNCVDADDDQDGLSDAEESNHVTNPLVSDTDGDSVSDGKEVEEHTDPLDPGSFAEPFAVELCAEWNTFLGIHNIAEIVNRSAKAQRLSVLFYAADGSKLSSRRIDIPIKGQLDLDVAGILPLNQYGLSCLRYGADPGDIDARMLYYGASGGNSSSVQILSYSFAFDTPLPSILVLPLNTIDPQGQGRFVANWLQLSNASSTSTSGRLLLYTDGGERISERHVRLGPYARKDYAGHVIGRSAVGYARWEPDKLGEKVLFRESRIYAAEKSGIESVVSALGISGLPPTRKNQYLPFQMFGARTVVEISNPNGTAEDFEVHFYTTTGKEILALANKLEAHGTKHVPITNEVFHALGEPGYMRIVSPEHSGMRAFGSYYKDSQTDDSFSATALSGRESVRDSLTLSFNTFNAQVDTLLLVNVEQTEREVQIDLRAWSGKQLFPGILPVVSLLPGQMKVLPLERLLEVDTYGSVELELSVPKGLVAWMLREREPNNLTAIVGR